MNQDKEKGAKQFQKQKKVVGDLLTSAENGDMELLEKTVAEIEAMKGTTIKDALISFKDAHKRTALHFAAAKGRRKVVKYLIAQSPECVHEVDEEGSTALLYAAKENEFSTMKLLLESGADANKSKTNGTTALHEAAANGSARSCSLLLDNGADIEASTPNGTSLHMAVSEDREKTVATLIERHANVNAKNQQGVTPLLLCCLMNKPVVARKLLEAGADLSITIMGGITALHIAAETGFVDVVQAFLETRSDDTKVAASTKTNDGATPLQLAAGMGHHEIVQLLQPLTGSFENADINEVMETEKQKLDAYYEKAAAEQSESAAQVSEEDKRIAKQIEEVVPEDQVVAPTVSEVSEDRQTKAVELKNAGNKKYLAKEYKEAVDLYSQAIEENPLDPILYSNRCAAYLGDKEAGKALNDVRISKKLKPKWAKALFREGQCLEALKLYEDAAYALWNAVQLAPDDKVLKKRFHDCVARGREDHFSKKST